MSVRGKPNQCVCVVTKAQIMSDRLTGFDCRFTARILRGHRVASGSNGNPIFPGGTLRMQVPFFLERGLDLRGFYMGTLNVSVAPLQYRVGTPTHTFPRLRWHPTEPPEDFSFFDLVLIRPSLPEVFGFVYYPHPETKPTHFQSPDTLELLLPFVDGLAYGQETSLATRPNQLTVEVQR